MLFIKYFPLFHLNIGNIKCCNDKKIILNPRVYLVNLNNKMFMSTTNHKRWKLELPLLDIPSSSRLLKYILNNLRSWSNPARPSNKYCI